jgi:hypothetical protein
MFVLCVVSEDKRQNAGQSRQRNKYGVQENIKNVPVEATFSAPIHTGPGGSQPAIQWAAGLLPGAKVAGAWR